MKDKIYKYLREHPEGASTSELFERFFHIYGSHPEQMEKILTDMLSSDARFVKDVSGSWIVKSIRDKKRISDCRFLLVDFDYVKVGKRTEFPVAVAISQVENLKVVKTYLLKIDFSQIYGDGIKTDLKAEKIYSANLPDFQEISDKLFDICKNSILVSMSPYKHQEWLNALFRHWNGLDIEFFAISLRELYSYAFPEFPAKNLSDMLNTAKISHLELADLKARIDAQVDLFFELLQSQKLNNINDIDSLIEVISEREQWVDFSKYQFNREFLRDLPEMPGVYFFIDEKEQIFYVGKSKNLRSRVSSYFVNRRTIDEKHKTILDKIKKIHYQLVGSELEALLLENQAILENKPFLNVQIKIKPLKLGKYKKEQFILFLPATDANKVFLLFIDGIYRANSLILNRESSKIAEICRKEIEEFFFKKEKCESEYSSAQIEIIWRWFELNEEHINYLSVNEFSSLDSCTEATINYLKDKDLFSSHILYRES